MRVTCPRCGASFNVPDTARFVVCPYCGTVLSIRNGEAYGEGYGHFYYRVSEHDPYPEMINYLYRYRYVPRDFREAADMVWRKLYYVPLYSYYVEGEAYLYRGDKLISTYTYTRHVAVPAKDLGTATRLLIPWDTAVYGKRFYDPRIREMGEYHEPEYHPLDASWMAELAYKWSIYAGVRMRFGYEYRGEAAIHMTEFRGLVHYPVWVIRYRYRGKEYTGYVDGVDNRVILAEHPVKKRAKAAIAAYAAAAAAVSAAASYAIVSMIPYMGGLSSLSAIASAVAVIGSASHLFPGLKGIGYSSSTWPSDLIPDLLRNFVYFPDIY